MRGRVRAAGVRSAILLCAAAVLAMDARPADASVVHVVRIDASINPATADYLMGAIDDAHASGAAAVLVELDTPGGLVASMMDIVGRMLNADVPVIVHVTPRGAMAGSAGVFITMAAHVAAMAPGTTIGAAHPVSIGGANPKPSTDEDGESKGPSDYGLEKAENMLAKYVETIAKERGRNTEWAEEAVRHSVVIDSEEALEKNVIDLVVDSRRELLERIEGREVTLKSGKVTLSLANASFSPVEMTLGQRFFAFLVDPNVAAILLMAGLAGLYIEFNNPGLIVPGAVGLVCLALTGIAMQILPFSWAGLLLIAVGIALLVAEIFVTSFGLLFAAGIACLLFGGSMLFHLPEESDLNVSFWTVLVPAVAGVAAFGGIAVFALSRSLFSAQTAGVDELIGLVGKAATPVGATGKVFVRGEYWNASSDDAVGEGEAVEIVGVEGLALRVRRARKR